MLTTNEKLALGAGALWLLSRSKDADAAEPEPTPTPPAGRTAPPAGGGTTPPAGAGNGGTVDLILDGREFLGDGGIGTAPPPAAPGPASPTGVTRPIGSTSPPPASPGLAGPQGLAPTGLGTTAPAGEDPAPFVPVGYDPARARVLAPRVIRNLKDWSYSYDRDLVREFQVAAALRPADAIPGRGTRSALSFYSGTPEAQIPLLYRQGVSGYSPP